MKLKLFSALMGVLLAFSGARAGTVYDFNDPAQLNDFRTGTTNPGWEWSPDAGMNGTGGLAGLANSSGGGSWFIQKESFAGNTPGFTLSAIFQWATPVYGTGHGFSLGIIGDLNGEIAQNTPGTPLFYFGIGRTGTTNVTRFIGNWANSENSGVWQSDHAISMVDKGWYQISGDVTWNAALQTYEVAVSLYLIENDEFTLLASGTYQMGLLTELYNDDTVHAFFGSANAVLGRGSRAVDQFVTPVPEPGFAWGVAGMLFGLYGLRYAKRK